jgi:hypothetical protein
LFVAYFFIYFEDNTEGNLQGNGKPSKKSHKDTLKEKELFPMTKGASCLGASPVAMPLMPVLKGKPGQKKTLSIEN